MSAGSGAIPPGPLANAATPFVDAPLTEGLADRPALVGPAGAISYAALRRLTDRAGHALRALGVEPEQRVAMLLPDGPAWAAVFFAALKLGAVAVPLNTRLGGTDLRVVLADCRPKVLVVDPQLHAAAGSALDGLGIPRVVGWESLVAGAPDRPLESEAVGPDAMAFWLYTSGTTGSPKAAVHCHRTLPACRFYGQDVLGVTPADRVFATSKLFFAYALGNALLIPLFARASTYLHPEWPDPRAIASVLREFRPTLFFSVPTVYARLLRADLPADAFASARLCVAAGERLPTEVYRAWRERFGVEILDGIGATETVFMVLSNRPGQSRAGCSGVPVPGTEARILDGEGRPVTDGEPGVLWVRTPSQAAGYWKRLDHSRRTFVGEWFRTGDVYRRDPDGAHVHCGREDDFFKVAGQWVAPAEVESVLLRHPGVLDGGVVGAEEAGGLIKPFVFVVPRDPAVAPEALRADVRRFLESALPPHQRPRDVRVVKDLPRTATGKLQRFRLRDLCREPTR
ncbi:MAG TPA: benzoate-CoA ligase family protein [Candidatus Bathyarchaeia archaeon]|nr:benzoate-CoA ligase family protein [Candidatus Bathyarchaeia archaeon]